jgi:hypothetical protein
MIAVLDLSAARQFTDTGALQEWAIIQAPTEGVALEFGVAGGLSLRRLAAHRFVYGFDSFTGLPEDWRPGYPQGMFACAPPDIPNTELIVGVFADTVPAFVARGLPVAFIHIDCDLFSSTVEALRVAPLLLPGAIILFDELIGYEGFEQGEYRALAESGIDFQYIAYCGEQVAIRVEQNGKA